MKLHMYCLIVKILPAKSTVHARLLITITCHVTCLRGTRPVSAGPNNELLQLRAVHITHRYARVCTASLRARCEQPFTVCKNCCTTCQGMSQVFSRNSPATSVNVLITLGDSAPVGLGRARPPNDFDALSRLKP